MNVQRKLLLLATLLASLLATMAAAAAEEPAPTLPSPASAGENGAGLPDFSGI